MPHPDRDKLRISHMLEHAEEAIRLCDDKSRDDLDNDRVLQLALTHLVEIVGEAAARVTVETRERFGDVPWPLIVGMRNQLIHGYDAVDFDILWRTVKEDLPTLANRLRRGV